LAAACWAQQEPQPVEGDWIARDFTFTSGERLAELRLHYITLGAPSRNAVLILHGTGGSSQPFLSGGFLGALFLAGQPLDASKYYIILPDAIGHGESSKPSDGLHAKFPRYDDDDMVRAQYRLVREGLGVDHLRLVMGTGAGGMHTWLWGEKYPDFMDALMPLASAPAPIAGRQRLFRDLAIDAIQTDPGRGLVTAEFIDRLTTSSALELHKYAPTSDVADAQFQTLKRRFLRAADPIDMLYRYESSRRYDPSAQLEKITAPLFAVNFADDELNPPELGILEREIRRVAKGRYVLIPASDETRGHATAMRARVWRDYVTELLGRIP
jgi:homoserine O-acetyltransferase/O-succinyltransferase